MPMDHDRLFKELLNNFFLEFVELFLPDVSAYLDKDAAVVPLDKEVFTDVTRGDRHEVDLLMKVKFREEMAFFLVHIENQATAQADFPKRMFRYFARLTENTTCLSIPSSSFLTMRLSARNPSSIKSHFRVKRSCDLNILSFSSTACRGGDSSIRQTRLPAR